MMDAFYTRNGDDGYTGYLGKGRLPKSDLRIEALGSLDEANAALGIARSLSKAPETAPLILMIQRDLYQLMAEVAAPPEHAEKFKKIVAANVTWLEERTDLLQKQVILPKEFIVPGDTTVSAFLDLARTIVRRAERVVTALYLDQQITNQEILRYLNRLSSFCYVLELRENRFSGKDAPTLVKP
jgi:cob(I)alamin adenosyltransferase